MLATLPAAVSHAQQAPDAGRLLQETRPPAAPAPATPPRLLETPVRPTVNMPEGVTVTPSAFRISGAVSFPAEALAKMLDPWVGKRLDLRALNEAAGAITRHYQSAGHFLSYAYLPAQRVADGVIEIAVLEGRIDQVQVANAPEVRLRDEVVRAHVDDLADRRPALQADVERKLLLLNDMPGITARASFTPGAGAGTADMVVAVAEEEPVDFRFDASNLGSKATGTYRLGTTLSLRDLFGWGDTTVARLLASRQGGLVSGLLSTLFPVGGDGWKLGASVSRLTYELGGPFAALGATGTAQTWGVRAAYPQLRSTTANLTFEASAEHKSLADNIEPIGQRRPKRNTLLATGLTFDGRDALLGGGSTSGSLLVTAGHLRLLDTEARNLDRFGPPDATGTFDPAGAGLRTDGSFQKLGFAVTRQQVLLAPLSALVRWTGQVARQNLDSSEKLPLGGVAGVRAYSTGEAQVDEGGILSAELRVTQEYLGGSYAVAVFYDRARGRLSNRPLLAGGNDVHLVGYGLGLQWNAGDLGLTASLGWRGNTRPTADGGDPKPRLLFQLFYTP
jgi:hemolysin activation/secretion protein